MVGHEDIRVERAFRPGERIQEPTPVAPVIGLLEEAAFPIVTALHDVQRHIGEVNALTMRQAASQRTLNEPDAFNSLTTEIGKRGTPRCAESMADPGLRVISAGAKRDSFSLKRNSLT